MKNHASLTISITALLFVLLRSATVQAAFCEDVHQSLELSDSGFSSIKSEQEISPGLYSANIRLFDAERCEVIDSTFPSSLRCSWSFDYQALLAETRFDELTAALSQCLGDKVTVEVDMAVNHPDTYRSELYQVPDIDMRVTLKKKFALKKKYVSLFVMRQP
ncbi:MAG: hypothetical protein AB8B63_07330 [Granulosicoccus sp.]